MIKNRFKIILKRPMVFFYIIINYAIINIEGDKVTTIYFMRHSETLKLENINNNDSLQLQNEKWPLTINGEQIAKEKSELSELKNFDYVYASKYVRTISTAKYFSNNKIIIDESFGERKFGIKNWDELPFDFEKRQFDDFNYKLENGESLNEAILREEKALLDILQKHNAKKITEYNI